MVQITDAGPLYRLVDIQGQSVSLMGISFEDLVPMLDRFPELKRALMPSRPQDDTPSLDFASLIGMGPRIVGAVIAASMGKSGDAEAEKWAMKLGIGYQVAMIKDIIEMTFPKGFGDFVDNLRAMGLLAVADTEGKPNGSGATGKGPGGNFSSLLDASVDTPVTPNA